MSEEEYYEQMIANQDPPCVHSQICNEDCPCEEYEEEQMEAEEQ